MGPDKNDIIVDVLYAVQWPVKLFTTEQLRNVWEHLTEEAPLHPGIDINQVLEYIKLACDVLVPICQAINGKTKPDLKNSPKE